MLKLSLLGIDPTTQSFGPAPFLVSRLRGRPINFSTWTFFPVLASGPLPSLFLGLGPLRASSAGPRGIFWAFSMLLDLFPTFSGPRGLFWGFCRASGLFWFSELLLSASYLFWASGPFSGPFLEAFAWLFLRPGTSSGPFVGFPTFCEPQYFSYVGFWTSSQPFLGLGPLLELLIGPRASS